MSDITIKKPEEIQILREGGKILAEIVSQVGKASRPGVTTLELEELARKLIKEAGVKPSFQGFGEPPYPAVLCTSNNEGLVHCIPNKIPLKEGDILGIDCGIWYKDLCTDHAITVGVGQISKEAEKLMSVTKKCLDLSIAQIKPGNTLGDIGYAAQQYAEKYNYGIIRQLVGHGVGYKVHEPPRIPNFGNKNEGEVLKEGMVLALEPMLSMGDYNIDVLDNGWDIVMKDGSLAAHFEHTVVVTKKGVEILTK